MTLHKLAVAWKYRRLLWRYRKLYQRRKQIAAVALTSAILTGTLLLLHRAK